MSETCAEVISIGNELLSGLTVNTNASFIASELTKTGIPVSWITTIADTHGEILSALHLAKTRAKIIVVTGGLGPTPDDLTKKAIAEFFKTTLILHQPTLDKITRFFEGRGMVMPEINKTQAMVPASANVIPNNLGTAPGLEFLLDKQIFYFLPGVPHEMKELIRSEVLIRIGLHFEMVYPDRQIFRTNGLAESALYKLIQPVTDADGSDYRIAFLPRSSGVDLRIQSDPGKTIDKDFTDRLRSLLANHIYSESDASLPEVIGKLLITKGLSLSVAESFTGGALSDWITNVPGSSAYFFGSVVTYSNKSKIDLLSVSETTLKQHGAVSAQTVEEMVRGVRSRFSSDCAIASTGIAGPGGETEQKPVGLCYLAALAGDRTSVTKYNFGRDRRINKERGAAAGLELLRRLLLS